MTDIQEGDFENNVFDESEDIQQDYSTQVETKPIFKPWLYEFNYPLTFSEYKLLRDNKRNSIQIPYEGSTIEVYVWEIDYSPLEPEKTRFVCIEANV